MGMTLVFALITYGSYAKATDNFSHREVSKDEFAIMKQVASAGSVSFRIRNGTAITDNKGQKRKLIVALKGRYRLTGMQPKECSDRERVNSASNGEFALDGQGLFHRTGPAFEADDNAKEIEISQLTYVRIETKNFFSKSELFCVYELEKAGVALAVDTPRLLDSMWTNVIPVTISASSENHPTENSIDFNVESNSFHGAYPGCRTEDCSISITRNSTAAVTLNFVR